MASKFSLREEWLMVMADRLRKRFQTQEFEVPDKLRLSCGFPSVRGLSKKNRRVGECWWASAAKDGINHIFVSPLLETGLQAGGVLAHELLHAGLPEGAAHGPEFKRAMKKVGLSGKPTSAMPGPELNDFIAWVIQNDVGEYPHGAIDPINRPVKKQSTRMLKLYCPPNEEHETEYIVRASKKVIDIGVPTCPCGKEMKVEEPDEE